MSDFNVIKENPMIEVMSTANHWDYNIDKTIEELFELGEVLMKNKLKWGGDKEPTDQAIIEEIGDVQIRLDVLKKLFGEWKVDKRVEDKLTKFEEYYKEGKYIGRI